MPAEKDIERPVPRREERGAAAVEMAIMLPLLLLVLFGLVDFGRAFNYEMQVSQAAREAVRVKALGGTDADARSRALASIDAPSADVALAFPTVCSASPGPGDNAKVTVTYSFKFITPVGPIASIFGANTIPGAGVVKPLSADGVMRCAG